MKTLISALSMLVGSLTLAADLTPLKTVEVNLSVLTDSQGMTVYVYDRDTKPGVSQCTGGCAVVWPPVAAPAGDLAAPLSVVVRADGSRQIAYQGHPLYLYAEDSRSGDINGDGVQNIWHVVHP